MNKNCFIVFAIIVLHSCTQKSNQVASPTENTSNTDSFFPVTSYIKGQIFVLDSLPITPLHINIIKGKSDSTWLSKEKLKPLLMPFLEPVINETNLNLYFKETRFNDQTLNAITFTYDPVTSLPDTISLRHWDVYIDPEKGNVTKVYIVKQVKQDRRIFTQQLTWQSDKFAKIVTILNNPNGKPELVKEDIFTWNFN